MRVYIADADYGTGIGIASCMRARLAKDLGHLLLDLDELLDHVEVCTVYEFVVESATSKSDK